MYKDIYCGINHTGKHTIKGKETKQLANKKNVVEKWITYTPNRILFSNIFKINL